MSKEEILKIQTCVLKVNIHCDGCKQKIKKILQKIDGVFKTTIDSEQGKVTVSGNVDPALLIKKLTKSGKHAEIWGAQKPNSNNKNNNQSLLSNQLKNMQIANGKGGGGNNKAKTGGNNNNINQPKGGQHQQVLNSQQLQQLHQIKGFQDLNLPQFEGLKMPFKDQSQSQKQKTVKFHYPEDDFCDGSFDEYEDDDDDDDEFDDALDDARYPPSIIKPMMGSGQGLLGQNFVFNGMMNGNHPQMMNAHKGGNAGGNGGDNGYDGKKGGGGGGGGVVALPAQMTGGGNGGKKGKGGGGGGKNGGGGLPQDAKTVNNGGGSNNKSGQNGGYNVNNSNGKKGGGGGGGNNAGFDSMSNGNFHMGGPKGMAMGIGNLDRMGGMNIPTGQMGNLSMGQMGGIPAVQGLPTAGAGGSPYFQGATGQAVIPGNPYLQQQQQQQQQLQQQLQQQQYLAAMMNQQRAMGNERFQPMMYARPPSAVNYAPPPYYPYPCPPPGDQYSHFFSDENTSSCNVM